MTNFLFIIAWLIGFLSLIFMFIEGFATLKFSSWSFTNGIIVLKRTIQLPVKIDKNIKSKALKNCKIKIASENEIYFWNNIKRTFFSRNSAFAIKGTITKQSGQWIMTGRIPISSTLFVLAFSLVCFIVGGIFLFIGLGLVLLIFLSCVVLERKRSKTVVSEIESYF